MISKTEKKSLFQILFKRGKSAAGTHEMLQEAYGDNAHSQTTTFEWLKWLRDGREPLEDAERSGRPST